MLMNKQTMLRGGEYTAPTLRNLYIRCESGFAESFTIDPIGEDKGEWDE